MSDSGFVEPLDRDAIENLRVQLRQADKSATTWATRAMALTDERDEVREELEQLRGLLEATDRDSERAIGGGEGGAWIAVPLHHWTVILQTVRASQLRSTNDG